MNTVSILISWPLTDFPVTQLCLPSPRLQWNSDTSSTVFYICSVWPGKPQLAFSSMETRLRFGTMIWRSMKSSFPKQNGVMLPVTTGKREWSQSSVRLLKTSSAMRPLYEHLVKGRTEYLLKMKDKGNTVSLTEDALEAQGESSTTHPVTTDLICSHIKHKPLTCYLLDW